jgi:Lanthionine synthetase C-like protein
VAPRPPDPLWSPGAHEELGGEPWSAGRARDAIAAICRDAEDAFGTERLWPAHPLDGDVTPDELKTVYLGAAGIIWALDRLSRAGVHQPAHDWPMVAAQLAAGAGPLPRSLLAGRTGILLVAWLVGPDTATAGRLADAVAANIGNETNELLWGSPGTMFAAAAMLARTGDARFADLWRRSAAQLLSVRDPDGCWTQELYGQKSRYFGAGHGFAGAAHALLQRPDLLEDAGAFAASAGRVVVGNVIGRGETANWPPHAGGPLEVSNQTIRVQWCHGAPGVVTSMVSAEPGDDELTRVLVAGGELTWRAGPLAKGAGLCHGTAGNAFAFLALQRRTGDELWLERARAFAMHAAGQVERSRGADGRGRYSLWTGDIGVAILLQRCLDGGWDGFPTLDAW